MLLFGTKARDVFKAWAKKDKQAQIEGTKRLGLPENNTAADRAKAMGFDMDRTEYHGTKFDFDEFNPKQSTRVRSEHGDSRGATYMTDIPELANRFSMSLKNGVTETFDGGRVFPLVRRGNLFDAKNPEHIKKIDEVLTQPKWKWHNNQWIDGAWYEMERPATQQILKDAGFDGYLAKETGVLKEASESRAVFDPANIRSPLAHFNPKYAGIGAGAVMSGNLMADELDLEYKGQEPSTWDSLMNTISGVNQEQAQAYGDTGAGTMGGTASLASMLATDPAVAGEVISTVGLKGIGAVSPYIKGFGLGLLLDAKEMGDGEIPNFEERLFAGEFNTKQDKDLINKLEGR